MFRMLPCNFWHVQRCKCNAMHERVWVCEEPPQDASTMRHFCIIPKWMNVFFLLCKFPKGTLSSKLLTAALKWVLACQGKHKLKLKFCTTKNKNSENEQKLEKEVVHDATQKRSRLFQNIVAAVCLLSYVFQYVS